MIARCFREFADFLDARPPGGNPEEDLSALGQRYIGYATSHPLECRLMFGTTWPDAAGDSELVRDSLHAFNVLREVLVRIHGAGETAREKVDLDAMFIWSSLHGLVTIAHSDAMRHLQLASGVDERVTQHVFGMIAAAMQSGSTR